MASAPTANHRSLGAMEELTVSATNCSRVQLPNLAGFSAATPSWPAAIGLVAVVPQKVDLDVVPNGLSKAVEGFE